LISLCCLGKRKLCSMSTSEDATNENPDKRARANDGEETCFTCKEMFGRCGEDKSSGTIS
jgi:hypothetical protein